MSKISPKLLAAQKAFDHILTKCADGFKGKNPEQKESPKAAKPQEKKK